MFASRRPEERRADVDTFGPTVWPVESSGTDRMWLLMTPPAKQPTLTKMCMDAGKSTNSPLTAVHAVRTRARSCGPNSIGRPSSSLRALHSDGRLVDMPNQSQPDVRVGLCGWTISMPTYVRQFTLLEVQPTQPAWSPISARHTSPARMAGTRAPTAALCRRRGVDEHLDELAHPANVRRPYRSTAKCSHQCRR